MVYNEKIYLMSNPELTPNPEQTGINDIQKQQFITACRDLFPSWQNNLSFVVLSDDSLDMGEPGCHVPDREARYQPAGSTEVTIREFSAGRDIFVNCSVLQDDPEVPNTRHESLYEVTIFSDGQLGAWFHQLVQTFDMQSSPEDTTEMARGDDEEPDEEKLGDLYRATALRTLEGLQLSSEMGLDPVFDADKLQRVLATLAMCGTHNQI